MIDLHTHSLFSDGVLLPSELVVRARAAGYTAIAITDHVDFTNIDFVIPRICKVADELGKYYQIRVVTGCEITYVPPPLIQKAVTRARTLGARIVIVHGETPVERVPAGTNLAGIRAGADILAHPGYILPEEVELAARKKVCLEITTRKGHCKSNSHVAALAAGCCAKLVLNTDSHQPSELLSEKLIRQTLRGAGLKSSDYGNMQSNSEELLLKNKTE